MTTPKIVTTATVIVVGLIVGLLYSVVVPAFSVTPPTPSDLTALRDYRVVVRPFTDGQYVAIAVPVGAPQFLFDTALKDPISFLTEDPIAVKGVAVIVAPNATEALRLLKESV